PIRVRHVLGLDWARGRGWSSERVPERPEHRISAVVEERDHLPEPHFPAPRLEGELERRAFLGRYLVRRPLDLAPRPDPEAPVAEQVPGVLTVNLLSDDHFLARLEHVAPLPEALEV